MSDKIPERPVFEFDQAVSFKEIKDIWAPHFRQVERAAFLDQNMVVGYVAIGIQTMFEHMEEWAKDGKPEDLEKWAQGKIEEEIKKRLDEGEEHGHGYKD